MAEQPTPSQPAAAVDEPEYPSGPWVGFYNYAAGGPRFRQELDLTFRNGRMAGEGEDIELGRFFIHGRYDRGERKAWWTKSYPGRHDVFYQGYREGKGIWGTWEIHPGLRGGFLIWPRGLGEGVEAEAAAEAGDPAPAAPAMPVPARSERGSGGGGRRL